MAAFANVRSPWNDSAFKISVSDLLETAFQLRLLHKLAFPSRTPSFLTDLFDTPPFLLLDSEWTSTNAAYYVHLLFPVIATKGQRGVFSALKIRVLS